MEKILTQEQTREKLIKKFFNEKIQELKKDLNEIKPKRFYVVSYDKESNNKAIAIRKKLLSILDLFFDENNVLCDAISSKMEPGKPISRYTQSMQFCDYIIVLATKDLKLQYAPYESVFKDQGLKGVQEQIKRNALSNTVLNMVFNLISKNKGTIISYSIEDEIEDTVPIFLQNDNPLPIKTIDEFYQQFFLLLKIVFNDKREIIIKHEKLFNNALKGVTAELVTEFQKALIQKKEKRSQETQTWIMQQLSRSGVQSGKLPLSVKQSKQELKNISTLNPEQLRASQREMTEILLAGQFQLGRKLLADIMSVIPEKDMPPVLKEQLTSLDEQCQNWQFENGSSTPSLS